VHGLVHLSGDPISSYGAGSSPSFDTVEEVISWQGRNAARAKGLLDLLNRAADDSGPPRHKRGNARKRATDVAADGGAGLSASLAAPSASP